METSFEKFGSSTGGIPIADLFRRIPSTASVNLVKTENSEEGMENSGRGHCGGKER